LSGAIRKQRITQKVKNRPLLLATGFNHREDAFHKSTAQVGLSPMRVAPPDHRMPQRPFGTVIGWLKPWDGCKSPEIGIGSQQATTRLSGTRRGSVQSNR
jgi:hypothetical protein